MDNFIVWLESVKSPFVYHITYYRNLKLINNLGLDYSEFGGTNFPKFKYHSQQGNFFTTDISQVANWIDVLKHQSESNYDNMMESGAFPVILKFKVNRNSHHKDTESEYPNSYFTKKIIQPQGIMLWNLKTWIPLKQWESLDYRDFLDYQDEWVGEEYWELRDDYPIPKS